MKYYIAEFKIACNEELMQTARELLADVAGEAGFEAFEDTTDGINGWIQQSLYNKETLDKCIKCFPLDNVDIAYTINEVEEQNWNQTWEEIGFEPINVADRCVIYDAKHTSKDDACIDSSRLNIFIETQNAFGTGTHQTTRMIISQLLQIDLHRKRVLDCGCGTGILGIAALKMGAEKVFAYDIDEWSANNAKHNADINNINNMQVALGDASILDNMNEQFDIVLANINRNILLNDMPRFVQKLNTNGTLIISGFYEDDICVLTKAAEQHNMKLLTKQTDDNWTCLLFTK